MKFLANENFVVASVKCLRDAGLDVKSICEDNPSITDFAVMQMAILENRTILTHDRDYGELVYRHGLRPPAGVIYFRLEHYEPDEPGQILLRLLSDPNFVFEGIFTVIDDGLKIRQRRIV